ncbi:MAG: ferritin family protein [Acidobacteriota bacterium]
MKGGIHAWNGLRATGTPEAGMAYLESVKGPDELFALAWLLEEGSRKFYEQMSCREKDSEEIVLFENLQGDEEKHKTSLSGVYKEAFGKNPDPEFLRSLVSMEPGDEYLEGGIRLKEALEWSAGKDLKQILEFSISLEVNAIDLYIKMERRVEGKEAKAVFQALTNQERNHLKRLSAALENRVPPS